jgi:hypothetical protein
MSQCKYNILDDIGEEGSGFKDNNLDDILKNTKTYLDDSIIVMFDQARFSRTQFLDVSDI